MYELQALEVLGLDCTSPWETVQERFRQLAKLYHPDLSGDPDTSLRFAAVRDAYDALKTRRARQRIFERPVSPQAAPREPGQEVSFWGKLLVEGLSEGIKVLAAGRLAALGRKTAFTYLKQALDDTSLEVRRASIRALGKLKLAQASGPLSARFSRERSELKLEILLASAETGFSGGYWTILEMARQDLHLTVRQKAHQYWAALQTAR